MLVACCMHVSSMLRACCKHAYYCVHAIHVTCMLFHISRRYLLPCLAVGKGPTKSKSIVLNGSVTMGHSIIGACL